MDVAFFKDGQSFTSVGAAANMRPKGKSSLFSVLLDVIEAEGEDLEDDLKEDFRPIAFFVFSFHRSKITKNYPKII